MSHARGQQKRTEGKSKGRKPDISGGEKGSLQALKKKKALRPGRGENFQRVTEDVKGGDLVGNRGAGGKKELL